MEKSRNWNLGSEMQVLRVHKNRSESGEHMDSTLKTVTITKRVCGDITHSSGRVIRVLRSFVARSPIVGRHACFVWNCWDPLVFGKQLQNLKFAHIIRPLSQNAHSIPAAVNLPTQGISVLNQGSANLKSFRIRSFLPQGPCRVSVKPHVFSDREMSKDTFDIFGRCV